MIEYIDGDLVEIENNTGYYTDDLRDMYELTCYATQFLHDNYNLRLTIPIEFAELDTNTHGLFWYSDTNNTRTPKSIELNQSLLDGDSHVIEKVLIHELTHYALFMLNQDFEDGTERFENEVYNNSSISNHHSNIMPLISKIAAECCD